jgi:secreted PhoX family phosphatase
MPRILNRQRRRRVHNGPSGRAPAATDRERPIGKIPGRHLDQCGNGYTPWGPYLTAKENFTATSIKRATALQPISVLSRQPREPNRFGWMVETDPYDPTSKPLRSLRGHVIRWKEQNPSDTTFNWDIVLFAGPNGGVDGSDINRYDIHGSADGQWIHDSGRLGIQTDGSQPDGSNNQMLMTDPATREIKSFLFGPVACEGARVAMTPDSRTMFVNIQHP